MLVMGIVSLMATIPQLYKLFFSHTQHAAGLSLVTWVLHALITLLWAIYGLYHKKTGDLGWQCPEFCDGFGNGRRNLCLCWFRRLVITVLQLEFTTVNPY